MRGWAHAAGVGNTDPERVGAMSSPVRPHALIPASYVYLRRGHEVLLQQRANTGYMDGTWAAGAAGHVEPGETARTAAVRELFEELGVHVAEDDLCVLTVMQRTGSTDDPIDQRVDWFWACTSWTGRPHIKEPAKCSGLEWFDLADLPAAISSYERLVLEGWRDGSLSPASAHGFGDPETLH